MHIDFHKLLEQFLYNPNKPLLFNSSLFLFLFLGFFAVYCLLYKHNKLKNTYVIFFSLYFYYKCSGFYFLLLIAVSLLDYNVGRLIFKNKRNKQNKRKRLFLLLISLCFNLGVLAYFKYANFFVSIFYDLIHQPFDPFNIFLPIGISFFTFQSLSYTIDIYRENLEPAKNYTEFAFYLTFFPQMVAGPIVRAADFLPQVRVPEPRLRKKDFGRAVFFVCSGLFKKAIISDYISLNFVDRVFDNPLLHTGLENLFAVYGYALQIYCDFSGYSDMAIGLALFLGYKLPVNFLSPYQSGSMSEFWRRWHISLSSWLRDYLYISLGGNQKGKWRTYINLMLTMLLGGLWHGAALRFIVWGGLHGLALVVEKWVKSFIQPKKNCVTHLLSVLLTFHFVCFCWIFFRSESMDAAKNMLLQIFTVFRAEVFVDFVKGYSVTLGLMMLGFVLHFVPKQTEEKVQNLVVRSPLVLKILYVAIIIFLVTQVNSSEIQPFIYFQF